MPGLSRAAWGTAGPRVSPRRTSVKVPSPLDAIPSPSSTPQREASSCAPLTTPGATDLLRGKAQGCAPGPLAPARVTWKAAWSVPSPRPPFRSFGPFLAGLWVESSTREMTVAPKPTRRLRMQYAGGLVKHLGLSMYRGAVPALAELISNSWDADATRVAVTIPFGVGMKDQRIQVTDDGRGMTWDEVQREYH